MTSKADLVIVNARIYTVDGRRPWAQAVAVSGGRIVSVGASEEVSDLVGPDTTTIDAQERLVLPGFIDSHVHFATGFMELSWVKLGSARTRDEVLDLVAEHARRHPEYKLVGGSGWKYEAIQLDGRFPTKTDLDQVVSDRPLLLQSYDGWVCLANSRFTDLAEEALKGKPVAAGPERDPGTGETTGVFLDPSDLLFQGGRVSELIRENVVAGMKEILAQAARYGITSIHDVQLDLADLRSYEQVRDEGDLKVRVYGAFYYHEGTTAKDLAKWKEARARHSDEWIRTGAVKLFIDGVLESHTAAMLEPYSNRPSSRGELKSEPEKYNRIVERLDEMGFQCLTHACGDRGVRTTLDAYENAQHKNGRRDSRHRIEHIEMISPSDIPRFRQLGVIASMQPEHAMIAHDSALARAAGEDRLRDGFPWRAIRDTGATLTFSSDWSVADLNPLVGIYMAVSRCGEAGHEQAVTLQEAIESYTINGARASFEEELKGSIEPGKLADFVILSQDLFTIPTARIRDVEVVLTIVGGKETYRSGEF